MHILLFLILAIAVLAIGLFTLLRRAHRPRVALANENIALQMRCENGRLLADSAIAQNLLVKYGSDINHAAICGASDRPIGNSDDAPGAAEDGFTVNIFGLLKKERIVIASEAIAADADVYTAANGKVQDEPAVAGTYYKVGRSSQSASGDLDKLRIIPCSPSKLIVLAAFGNANGEISALTSSGTTTQAEFNALRDKCEELADDVRALAGALGTDARVKILT